MTEQRSALSRMRSLRSMIAVAGVAAAAFGITQATGTMASTTQDVKTTSAVSTGNFYPTPLTASVTCTTNPAPTWNNHSSRRAEITWDAVPGATGYVVEFVDRGNGQVRRTEERGANDRKVSGVTATNPRGDGLYARVYTVNGPATSTGYTVSNVGMSHKDLVTSRTECEGSTGTNQPNQPWENQRDWDTSMGTPGQISSRSAPMMLGAPVISEDELIEESVEPTTEAPESTTEAPESTTETPESTPESTTPATTTPETTTPETSTPAETTPSSPSPTADPKPVLVETVPNGAVTAGWTQGHTRVVVVDADGHELAGGRVEQGSTLHWVNDQLWIVGASENFRIMRGSDGDWRFYSDGGDLPRELQGN